MLNASRSAPEGNCSRMYFSCCFGSQLPTYCNHLDHMTMHQRDEWCYPMFSQGLLKCFVPANSHSNAPAKNFSTWLCWMLSEHTKKHNTAKLRGQLLELFLLVLFFQRQKEHRRLSWEICGSTSSWVVALLLSHRTLFLLPIYPVNLICLDTA